MPYLAPEGYPKDPDSRMPVHSTALPDFSTTLDTHDS